MQVLKPQWDFFHFTFQKYRNTARRDDKLYLHPLLYILHTHTPFFPCSLLKSETTKNSTLMPSSSENLICFPLGTSNFQYYRSQELFLLEVYHQESTLLKSWMSVLDGRQFHKKHILSLSPSHATYPKGTPSLSLSTTTLTSWTPNDDDDDDDEDDESTNF